MAQGLKRIALYTLAGFLALGLVAFVAGGVIGYLSASGAVIEPGPVLVWLVVGIATAAMTGAMAITVAWMRAIDEAAREAHKSAWFWGGCGGMAVGGVLIILASAPPAAAFRFASWFHGRTDPAAYAATGAGALALLMVAGYTVAWVWWWWKRR